MRLDDMYTQWRMAKKYGYRMDLVRETVNPAVEKFFLCKLQNKHWEKFSSYGRCIRCGKVLR